MICNFVFEDPLFNIALPLRKAQGDRGYAKPHTVSI